MREAINEWGGEGKGGDDLERVRRGIERREKEEIARGMNTDNDLFDHDVTLRILTMRRVPVALKMVNSIKLALPLILDLR